MAAALYGHIPVIPLLALLSRAYCCTPCTVISLTTSTRMNLPNQCLTATTVSVDHTAVTKTASTPPTTTVLSQAKVAAPTTSADRLITTTQWRIQDLQTGGTRSRAAGAIIEAPKAPRGWVVGLSLIHIWRCRRIERCRSRWSPYH